jgi:hypothetical protein
VIAALSAGIVASPSSSAEPWLVDVTESTGIAFTHANGAAGLKDYRETMGSGVCLLDYDGDDRLDVYLVTCVGPNRLYRNLGGLRFADVTDAAGVGSAGYDMGAVAADWDRDGDLDLYVTSLGPNRAYVNRGDGTFAESAARLGIAHPAWGTGAAFFDADGDGAPDLYVANYVQVARPDTNVCRAADGMRLVCKPTDYPPAPDVLFRQRKDGTFEDATERLGFSAPAGRGLGVVTADADGDGRPDVYVANDLDPNYLFVRRGGGRYEETGFFSGTSHSETGRAESGMGVAAGDYDRDGRPDLFVTNFVGQTNTLYHNEGEGLFQDETAAARLGRESLPYVGWGAAFADFDGDGWPDLAVVNGHVEPDAEKVDDPEGWAQPDLLLHNRGDGTFLDVTAERAPGFLERHAGRGLAVGDLDDDGDPDLVVVNQNGPARVFRNDSEETPWIAVSVAAVGARVDVHAAGGPASQETRAGGSFLSCDDPRLLFRLGDAGAVDSVVVTWPSGARRVLRGPATGTVHSVKEPR